MIKQKMAWVLISPDGEVLWNVIETDDTPPDVQSTGYTFERLFTASAIIREIEGIDPDAIYYSLSDWKRRLEHNE